MTNQDELKPCPFCGSTNISFGEILGKHVNEEEFRQSQCLDCGACGPETEHTQSAAVNEINDRKAWNRRAHD